VEECNGNPDKEKPLEFYKSKRKWFENIEADHYDSMWSSVTGIEEKTAQ
jgi:hypothetical protein|tara:strand:+ start:293 stop:439 length:147 start_codon:yes stop_codon:yes gene_type:complete